MKPDKEIKSKKNPKVRENLFYLLGFILIGGYIFLYFYRFLNMHPDSLSPQVKNMVRILQPGREALFFINSLIFVLFLVFIPYKGKIEWRSKGAFSAFILALFAEMFGLPLLFYITSPFFGGESVPVTLPLVGKVYLFKHYFPLGWTGTVIGAYATLTGMVLVFCGWYQIHKATSLVDKGLYRYIRHPQYTGLFLIITGWMLHWATTITIIMYPILLFIYYRLSLSEENHMVARFGEQYIEYRKRSWMFFPLPLFLKSKT